MMPSSGAVDRVCVDTDGKPRRNSSHLDSWSPPPRMRPQYLTTAKTVAKISTVSNRAGGKKSVARRGLFLTTNHAASNAQTAAKTGNWCKPCLRAPVNDVPRQDTVGLTVSG